ncbi:unnamed protein product [Hanseniaspora opuntiae]
MIFKQSIVLQKCILITGSSKGLGNALGRRIVSDNKLREKYTHLIIHGSTETSLRDGLMAIDKLNNKSIKVSGFAFDFSNPNNQSFEEYAINNGKIQAIKKHESLKKMFKENKMDEIILNHAMSKDSLIYNVKPEIIQDTFNVNIISYINIVSSLLNIWVKENYKNPKERKITTIGSILNQRDILVKGNMVYAMTKKNVEMLSEYIKLEYGERLPWLKVEHYNVPFMMDTSLVTNKKLLENLNIEKDTTDNVTDMIFNPSDK